MDFPIDHHIGIWLCLETTCNQSISRDIYGISVTSITPSPTATQISQEKRRSAVHLAKLRSETMNWARHYLCRALPYGYRHLEDGSRIYFDRQYRNLAQVWPDGRVEIQEANFDHGDAPMTHFYPSGGSPRRQPTVFKKIRAVAEEFDLMPHIKERARADYDAYRVRMWRKPHRPRILE